MPAPPVSAAAAVVLPAPAVLPAVPAPRWVVCSDFDETYFAHDRAPEHVRARRELDAFLLAHGARLGIVFGIITGSAFARLAERAEAQELHVVPHFVSSSLGTQTYFFDGAARAAPDAAWQTKMHGSGFTHARVAACAAALQRAGFALQPQPEHTRGTFKQSYYLPCADTAANAARMQEVRVAAAAAGLAVNVSFCNPAVGDLLAGYDVDFIAAGAGKAAAMQHALTHYGVDPAASLAFGESGNDLGMLRAAGHGYLVANATPEALAAHGPRATQPYAAGILEVLRRHVGSG